MLVFYAAAAVVIFLGILSLRNGFNFASYVRRELVRPVSDYAPRASLIAPARGLDEGLRENILPLLNQNYPDYEVIFVTDAPNDPSLSVVEDVRSVSRISSSVVVAGDALDSGQKVHNLIAAVSHLDPRSEVIVFVDTDARPDADWLRFLVAPLSDERIGAATGYRWFMPARGGFASHLRSVWNASIASALGARGDKNFCWGGSTAIRRATFDRLKIRERWRGTVSDDFTVTRALHEADLPIHFVPACLVPSFDDCNFRQLMEFTNRQLKITRVYAPHLWRSVLIGSSIFTAVFFGGLVLVITRGILGFSFAIPLLLVFVIYALGAVKSYIRLQAVNDAMKVQTPSSGLPAHLFLWPVASALFLVNALAAAGSRRINWRGITYELKSHTEAVIIHDNQ